MAIGELKQGGEVRIPCTATKGAFEDECLISIDTVKGPIGGFINSADVKVDEDGEQQYVLGVVQQVEGDNVIIRLRGSFFTTTGIAYFSLRQLELEI